MSKTSRERADSGNIRLRKQADPKGPKPRYIGTQIDAMEGSQMPPGLLNNHHYFILAYPKQHDETQQAIESLDNMIAVLGLTQFTDRHENKFIQPPSADQGILILAFNKDTWSTIPKSICTN